MDDNSNNFKQQVKDWLDLDDQINALLIAIKERKQKKINITQSICNFMKQHEIGHMDIQNNGGKLKYSQTNIAPPIKKITLTESLTEYFQDAELAKKAVEHIYKTRQKKPVISLRRLPIKSADNID